MPYFVLPSLVYNLNVSFSRLITLVREERELVFLLITRNFVVSG